MGQRPNQQRCLVFLRYSTDIPKLPKSRFQSQALPFGRMQTVRDGADLFERVGCQGGDTVEGPADGRGWMGNLRDYYFQLKADGGQHLAHTAVQLAAQALAFQLDLADGCSPGASWTASTEDNEEVTFRRLEIEVVPHHATVQVQQAPRGLRHGGFRFPFGADQHPIAGGQDAREAQGSGGRPTAGSSSASRAFDSLYQIVHPAEDRARPVAHPEHLAAQVAFQKHRKGDRSPGGRLGLKAVVQPGISRRKGSFRGSFLGQNASIIRALQSPYVPSTLLTRLRIESVFGFVL